MQSRGRMCSSTAVKRLWTTFETSTVKKQGYMDNYHFSEDDQSTIFERVTTTTMKLEYRIYFIGVRSQS
jgi:hypothetical protein